MLTVTIGDDRLLHEDDGPRDHASMMREFRAAAQDSPGVTRFAEAFITPFAEAETASGQREAYYRYVVEITLAGPASGLVAG